MSSRILAARIVLALGAIGGVGCDGAPAARRSVQRDAPSSVVVAPPPATTASALAELDARAPTDAGTQSSPTDVIGADEADAHPELYDNKTIRVRGRLVRSGLSAGFPLVYFVDAAVDARKLEDDAKVYVCRGPFEPGRQGATFEVNALIVATGTLERGPRGPKVSRLKLALAECEARRE